MIRALLMIVLVALCAEAGHAAEPRHIQQLKATLETPTDPELAKRGVKDREIELSFAPKSTQTSPVIFFYGLLHDPDDSAEAAEESARIGVRPLPDTPAFAVLIPYLMCVYYLVDEKSNGVVTHSGSTCSIWGGFTGQRSGTGNDFFKPGGGPQKMYDAIIAAALKQLKTQQ